MKHDIYDQNVRTGFIGFFKWSTEKIKCMIFVISIDESHSDTEIRDLFIFISPKVGRNRQWSILVRLLQDFSDLFTVSLSKCVYVVWNRCSTTKNIVDINIAIQASWRIEKLYLIIFSQGKSTYFDTFLYQCTKTTVFNDAKRTNITAYPSYNKILDRGGLFSGQCSVDCQHLVNWDLFHRVFCWYCIWIYHAGMIFQLLRSTILTIDKCFLAFTTTCITNNSLEFTILILFSRKAKHWPVWSSSCWSIVGNNIIFMSFIFQ